MDGTNKSMKSNTIKNRYITVIAKNREAAEQIVKEKYKNLEIILDESDHISTDFKTLKETRILENKER